MSVMTRAWTAVPSIHIQADQPNVFLFGTPRGGSTWLMELIASQPGFKYCNEPLNLRTPQVKARLQTVGINTWVDLYTKSLGDNLEQYKVLRNGRLPTQNPRPKLKNRNFYRLFTNRLVFKVLNGGEDRVNWIANIFNGQIVFLLRHPIAVSLSRKVLPRLNAFLSSDYRDNFTTEQLRYADDKNANGNMIERGMLSWCLQNALPLRQIRDDWSLITYEQLVLDPEPVLQLLVNNLNLPQPERMRALLGQPSQSSHQSDAGTQTVLATTKNRAERQWLVEKWREDVSADNEKRLMAMLGVFEIDVYRAGEVLPTTHYWV